MKKLARAKFKVKINSLAEESRIIRRQVKALGKQWKRASGPSEGQWEFQSPRYEIALAQTMLNNHRIEDVRGEQRATLLAYAFLRGVPYSVVENNGSGEIPTDRVRQIAKSLAGALVSADDLAGWLIGRKAAA